MTRLERKLAELVVGRDGGWSLWLAALLELEEYVADARCYGQRRFESYPAGELSRLLNALDCARARAAFAVDARQLAQGDEEVELAGEPPVEVGVRVDVMAAVLLDRARARAAV